MNKYIHALLNTPPKYIPGKTWRVIRIKLQSIYELGKSLTQSTYSDYSPKNGQILESYFTIPSKSKLIKNSDQILYLSDQYLNHRFDLLGSGWVENRHGITCKGLENIVYRPNPSFQVDAKGQWLSGRINNSNLNRSKQIWKLIDSEYIPIDWHLDFISGYRWKENTLYLNIPYGHLPGVDIKVPWELARMQHLPMLAYAYSLAKDNHANYKTSESYSNEFRNQVLDFIATNPPRFGVNWRCPMDVAIRATNWLVAYDLLKSSGAKFDRDFTNIFMASIYDHGIHIINNLEWNKNCTSNHYLANIAGLVFISAYLPESEVINSWLAFAISELVSETKTQFNEDGSNYECSTNYHRLSAEMVAYSTAIILGFSEEKSNTLKNFKSRSLKIPFRQTPANIEFYKFPKINVDLPFPAWFIERLERMELFTSTIAKPNGVVPQIGDNDSGRFLKLWPKYKKYSVTEVLQKYNNLDGYKPSPDNSDYLMEEHLDHSHLSSTLSALFKDRVQPSESIDFELIKHLIKNREFTSKIKDDHLSHPSKIRIGNKEILNKWIKRIESIPEKQKIEHLIPINEIEINNNLTLHAFPNFGIYIYKISNVFLSIRCGKKVESAPPGHIHNDQLTIELYVNGEERIRDPGTYVYTPLPDRRNQFRSVNAHFAPSIVGKEPNRLSNLLFSLEYRSHGECLYFGEMGFLGMHIGYGHPIYRMVLLKSNSIIIHDFTEADEEILCEPPDALMKKIPYSPGYGIIQNS